MSAGKAGLFCASASTPISLTVLLYASWTACLAGDGWLAAIHAQAVCYGCASCWISEFQSSSLVRRWVDVYPFRAVLGGDVAEAALVFAGHSGGWLVRGNPSDQGSEVRFELRVETSHGYSSCPRRIDYFSGQLGVLELRQRSGQGVHVDHDLYEVRGLFPSSFDVDDQGVVAPHDDQIGPAGQGG